MSKLRIAVVGAGLIGRTHSERASRHDAVELAAIADPADDARELAAASGVPWYRDHRAMLDAVKPGGVVVATPNATHAEIAIECLERGAAVIVEKPIADSVADARRICEASARTGLPARTAVHTGCPYTEQLRHFAAVVAGREAPVCSAQDATKTLEATLAVAQAAASGEVVKL